MLVTTYAELLMWLQRHTQNWIIQIDLVPEDFSTALPAELKHTNGRHNNSVHTLVYISAHSDKPFMCTNTLMKASQRRLCVFSGGGSRCRLRLFAASCRIEPRGPTAVTHLLGRSRGDRAAVTWRSLARVKGTPRRWLSAFKTLSDTPDMSIEVWVPSAWFYDIAIFKQRLFRPFLHPKNGGKWKTGARWHLKMCFLMSVPST